MPADATSWATPAWTVGLALAILSDLFVAIGKTYTPQGEKRPRTEVKFQGWKNSLELPIFLRNLQSLVRSLIRVAPFSIRLTGTDTYGAWTAASLARGIGITEERLQELLDEIETETEHA